MGSKPSADSARDEFTRVRVAGFAIFTCEGWLVPEPCFGLSAHRNSGQFLFGLEAGR